MGYYTDDACRRAEILKRIELIMKKGVYIIVAVTVLAVIFYGVRYVNMPVDILVAKAETKESIISAEGIIVYDESVYTAGNTGTFYSYTGEGERVGKDRCVATVYDGIVDKDVLQSLYNIDKKISDMEEYSRKNSGYVSNASSNQAAIESIRSEIIDAALEDNISKMSEYKNKLKNAAGVGGEDNTEQNLEQMKKEKESIEAKINQSNRDIYSNMSGIYTTSLDGLEGEIKPSDLNGYTVSDFKALKAPKDSIMGNRTVEKGDAVCKVVDNHEWYVVCVINKEERSRIEVGESVGLRVSELPGADVEAKIDYISEEGEGAEEYLAVIKCERYLEGVFNIRKSKIELILESYYGYEVPVYAIHARDGKNGVMVQGTGAEIFKECEILTRDNETGMVIITAAGEGSELSDGDKIILGDK